eukprot:scaffold234408_cov30-Tisochrysis_lutea.AAC.1
MFTPREFAPLLGPTVSSPLCGSMSRDEQLGVSVVLGRISLRLDSLTESATDIVAVTFERQLTEFSWARWALTGFNSRDGLFTHPWHCCVVFDLVCRDGIELGLAATHLSDWRAGGWMWAAQSAVRGTSQSSSPSTLSLSPLSLPCSLSNLPFQGVGPDELTVGSFVRFFSERRGGIR